MNVNAVPPFYGYLAVQFIRRSCQVIPGSYIYCERRCGAGIRSFPTYFAHEDAMRASHVAREGAYALGQKAINSLKVVYPSAVSGIVASYLLANRAPSQTMIGAIAAGMQPNQRDRGAAATITPIVQQARRLRMAALVPVLFAAGITFYTNTESIWVFCGAF